MGKISVLFTFGRLPTQFAGAQKSAYILEQRETWKESLLGWMYAVSICLMNSKIASNDCESRLRVRNSVPALTRLITRLCNILRMWSHRMVSQAWKRHISAEVLLTMFWTSGIVSYSRWDEIRVCKLEDVSYHTTDSSFKKRGEPSVLNGWPANRGVLPLTRSSARTWLVLRSQVAPLRCLLPSDCGAKIGIRI